MFRQFILICWLFFILPANAHSYAFLSEYISEDRESLRTSSAAGQDSDLIENPKWYKEIKVVLCTGGDAIRESDVNPGGDFEAWTDELLDQTNAALNTWKNAGSGTSLEIAAATKSEDCGPDEGEAYGKKDGKNRLFFNNVFDDGTSIPAGVIAFTVLSIELVEGRLEIVDADIIFNSRGAFNFQGVLTHELGHFLGIAHSAISDDNSADQTNTAASMFPAISGSGANAGEDLSELTLDDESAVQVLYPQSSSLRGKVSGYVYQANGQPQRGAHVTVFGVDEEKSLVGVFTSMNKTRSGANGSFSIRNVPLNKEFIVFVEPAHRPHLNPGFSYYSFNTPIQQALQTEAEGYRDFAIEAYPDVKIVDIRSIKNIATSPGISAAKVFKLTSSKKEIENLKFYLSQDFEAPNDAANTQLAINPELEGSLLINNDFPLQLYVEIPTDLNIFEDAEVILEAVYNGKTLNWSKSLPKFNWKSNSILLTTALPSPAPKNGTYKLKFKIDHPKYGVFTKTRTANIIDWTESDSNVEYGYTLGANETSGGGGCHIRSSASYHPFIWIFLAMGISLLGFRRSRLLLEAKSYRAQRPHEVLEPLSSTGSHPPRS